MPHALAGFMGEQETLDQELQILFKRHRQSPKNMDFSEHKLQKAGKTEELDRRKIENGVKLIHRKRGKEVIRSIRQPSPVAIGAMEAGRPSKI
jgi:hypothetical protein